MKKKCKRNNFFITQHVVLDPFVFKQISQVVLSIFIKEIFICKKKLSLTKICDEINLVARINWCRKKKNSEQNCYCKEV